VKGVGRSFLALLLAAVGITTAEGQAVRVAGGEGERAVRIANQVLARGEYQLIDRDTILGPEYANPGDLVVWDATVRLEGTVDGSVVVVGGRFHVRPNARVGGPIATIRGLALPSGLASVGEIVELTPGQAVLIERTTEAFVVTVVPPPRPPAVGVPGFWGIRGLAYDRVNGISAG
jgi:hypothetical protein